MLRGEAAWILGCDTRDIGDLIGKRLLQPMRRPRGEVTDESVFGLGMDVVEGRRVLPGWYEPDNPPRWIAMLMRSEPGR